MSLYLHPNLGSLAKLAGDAATRFATAGIRVLDTGGGYRAEVNRWPQAGHRPGCLCSRCCPG